MGHLGFGAMRIIGPASRGPPRDESEAVALLRRVVDKGVTSNSYGPGISETLIAKASYPAGTVVATKGEARATPCRARWSPIVGPSICALPVRTACEG